MAWRTGSDERRAWLQFGDFGGSDPEVLLAIERHRDSQHVEIQVRLRENDLDRESGRELPRYARFSFDHGRNADLNVSGVGFIVPADDGRVFFTTGQGGYDENLGLCGPVVAAIVDEFGLVIEGSAFEFPIDGDDLASLKALFDLDGAAIPF